MGTTAGWHCCCVCATLPHGKIVLESVLTDAFLCCSGKHVCLSFSSGSGSLLCYYIKRLCWSQALIQQPRRSLSYSELLRKGLHFYGVILRDMQRGLLYYYYYVFLSSSPSDAKCIDFPRAAVPCYRIGCFHGGAAEAYGSNEMLHWDHNQRAGPLCDGRYPVRKYSATLKPCL